MNSNKFIPILGLLLLLILAIGSVSASDMDSDSIIEGSADIDLTATETVVNEIDDSNIVKEENTENTVTNMETDEEIISDISSIDDIEKDGGAMDTLGSDNLPSTIIFKEKDYLTYFDANGNILDNKLKSGDTLDFSGRFNNRNFKINIPLTITCSDGTASLINCGFTFLDGSNGSSVSNLKINNSVAEKCIFSASDVSDITFRNNNLFSSGRKSHPISISTVNRINIFENTIQTTGYVKGWGHPSAVVIHNAASCNISSNNIAVNDTNGIYFTGYTSSSSMGSSGLDSSYSNYIVNNTVYSIRTIPSSYVYAIQVMCSNNFIINNTVYNVYRGISTNGSNNQIIGNNISNIHGSYYTDSTTEDGGDYAIITGYNSLVKDNIISNCIFKGKKAAIRAGQGSNVTNNNLTNISGMGAYLDGSDINFSYNDLNVTGYGVYIYGEVEHITVSLNNIFSNNQTTVKLEKQSSKKFPNHITIVNNTLHNLGVIPINLPTESNNVTVEPNEIILEGIISGELDEESIHYIFEYNFNSYFSITGTLENCIKENDTLIFIGEFSSKGKLDINQKVKIVGIDAIFTDTTFIINDDDVSIEDINISNPNGNLNDRLWGIQVNGVKNVTIKNCDISIYDPYSAYAIYLLEASNCSIINNTLQARGNYFTATILSFNSRDILIDGNRIKTIGSGDTYLINNKSCLDGYLSICVDACLDGSITCPDGYTICSDGSLLCPDGTTISSNEFTVCVDGSIVCTDGSLICADGTVISSENTQICADGICVDGVTYCLDGTVVLADGTRIVAGGYRVSSDGTVICPDGSVCTDGITVCPDGSVVCPDGTTLCTDGSVNLADGARICADGSIVCADGSIRCPDGSIISSVACEDGVCADGVTYCLDGTVVLADGTRIVAGGYRVSSDGTVICPDGSVCTDGITVCPDGSVVCPDGTTLCTDGSVNLAEGAFVCADGSIVCADGYIRCPDGTLISYEFSDINDEDGSICVDGTTYYRNGTIEYANGTVICLDGTGSSNFLDGVIPGSHMVSGVYRTYGVLLIHSSNVNFTNNEVEVSSDLTSDYNLNESYNSIAGVFIHYGGFNNTISNNNITLNSNDPIIYGMGIIGASPNSTAVGSKNNNFTNNNVKIIGPLHGVGIVLGYKSIDSNFLNNNFEILTNNSHKVLTFSGSENNTLEENGFTEKIKTNIIVSNVSYRLDDLNKIIKISLKDEKGNAIANTYVSISVNNKNYTVKTDGDGVASLKVTLSAVKAYAISARYAGDIYKFAADGTGKITVTKGKTALSSSSKTYAVTYANKYIYATLKDGNGKLLANKKITATVAGKSVSAYTNSKGVAKIRLSLNAVKTYTVAIKFAGDANYTASTKSITVKVIKTKTKLAVPNKTYRRSVKVKKLTATLKDQYGKILKYKVVKFTINGKTYKAKTNYKGVATLKVKLFKRKTYKFTVKFAGDKTYAGVSKTAKLVIK